MFGLKKSKQKQSSGAHSKNLQVGGDVHIGLSYDQAKEVALDVFKANFYDLSEKAKKIALERAEEITENFLKEIFLQDPPPREKLESPAVQASIFEVQKAYAKTGDKDLEKRLLAALVDRLKYQERSINQIVLDEAISTLPKLTDNEVKLLTFKECISEIRYPDNRGLEPFEIFIKDILLRFFPESISITETSHLLYCGCFTLPTQFNLGYQSLGDYYGQRYRGLFTNGFTEEEFMTASGGLPSFGFEDLVIKNLRFKEKLQFNALTDLDLENKLKVFNLGAAGSQLQKLWIDGVIPGHEIESLLVKIDGRMQHVAYMFNRSILPMMILTPVGHAIAISNYNQVMNTKLGFRAFSDTPVML